MAANKTGGVVVSSAVTSGGEAKLPAVVGALNAGVTLQQKGVIVQSTTALSIPEGATVEIIGSGSITLTQGAAGKTLTIGAGGKLGANGVYLGEGVYLAETMNITLSATAASAGMTIAGESDTTGSLATVAGSLVITRGKKLTNVVTNTAQIGFGAEAYANTVFKLTATDAAVLEAVGGDITIDATGIAGSNAFESALPTLNLGGTQGYTLLFGLATATTGDNAKDFALNGAGLDVSGARTGTITITSGGDEACTTKLTLSNGAKILGLAEGEVPGTVALSGGTVWGGAGQSVSGLSGTCDGDDAKDYIAQTTATVPGVFTATYASSAAKTIEIDSAVTTDATGANT